MANPLRPPLRQMPFSIAPVVRVLGFVLLLLLAGCKDPEVEKPLPPLHEAFAEAQQALEKKQWVVAAEKFRDIEANYPYSNSAATAQLLQAYAWYQAGDLGLSEVALQLFRERYPHHDYTDWVIYMQGLLAYEQISPPNREQEFSEDAYRYFAELQRDYPQSSYAGDARLKMALIENFHAGHNMEIGRLYQRLNANIAAAARFQTTIEYYGTSELTPEALFRLAESHRALGLHGEANTLLLVLNQHYPESEWYKRAYARWGEPSRESQADVPVAIGALDFDSATVE